MKHDSQKIKDIENAIFEARRFIRAALAAKEALKYDKTVSITGCKETAAAKRASMDLTRYLAELRRA